MKFNTLPARIQHLVNIKAAGNKSRFARMVGWQPQYMARVTKEDGASIGLAIVTKILEAFPDVDGRWLVLGEGEPITADNELKRKLYQRIDEYARLADHINYMEPSELEAYNQALENREALKVSDDQIKKWTKNKRKHEKGKGDGQQEIS